MCLEPVSFQLLAIPPYRGVVHKSDKDVAEVASNPGPTLLRVRAMDCRWNISILKTSPQSESDVVIEDARIGELVKIERHPTESIREQWESRLGFGMCKCGAFLPSAKAIEDELGAICLLAAMELYSSWIEYLFNTSHP